MCFGGGGASTDDPRSEASTKKAVLRYQQFQRIKASGGDEGWTDSSVPNTDGNGFYKPAGWDQKTADQKQQWLSYWDNAYKTNNAGPDGFDFQKGTYKDAAPLQSDLTDDLLAKTRTNFALRLQAGKNRSSSFSGTQTGGLDLSKPILGGY